MVREDDMQPDLADRLKKSLNLADVSVQGMADFLECNRNSVGGWLNRRNKPFSASLMIWAQKTGVPYEWLRDGTWPGEDQYDDQAELPAPDRLRQMSAALWQIANQLERP